MNTATKSLEKFLESKNEPKKFKQLTPDASTREYFRISWQNTSAIACIYPEPFQPAEQTYLDVTNLFLKCDLPVAEIYDFDGELGIIIQEDLGDNILRNVLDKSDSKQKENLINESIKLIAKIQASTKTAYGLNSIASKLCFDEEKLLWEMNFFKKHYFESLQKRKLSEKFYNNLISEFEDLSRELESFAEVLCHRDFHAANLMIDPQNKLRIIDHQDARIGSVCYDLVSFLLDRVTKRPDKHWVTDKKKLFLKEREKFNLPNIEMEKFNYEFELMTIQRCLKAIGTFSFQTANLNKKGYTQFIKPMFQIVLDAALHLQKFPILQRIIKKELSNI